MEKVTDFILGVSKNVADGDCSHEIRRHLFLERKAVTNLDSILKSGDITLPIKVHLQMVTAAIKLKDACSLEKSYDQPRQHIKKQRHYFADNVDIIKAMVFPVVV